MKTNEEKTIEQELEKHCIPLSFSLPYDLALKVIKTGGKGKNRSVWMRNVLGEHFRREEKKQLKNS